MTQTTPRFTNIAYVDFESFYDSKQKYSLKFMPTITYVRDERFQVFGAAVALNDEPSQYLTDTDLAEWLEAIDWSTTALCAFNCLFDGTVLTEIYEHFPCYYLCTLAVSRALLPIDRHHLKGVAPLLGLGNKGDALVDGAKGNNDGMADYANLDNDLSRGIYKMLYPLLPPQEHDLINLTIRGGVEPTLVLDQAILNQVRDDAVLARDAAIKASGYSEAKLSSNPQFADIIKGLGLQAPVKISDTTGEETTAFANGDDEYVSFTLEYPQYKHIWEGRKAAKSNINITRANKLLTIAKSGTMPMPLNYWGASTGRASGADGLNCFPGDHEILTPDGWVRIDQWDAKHEPIAQWWPNGDITWDSYAHNNEFTAPEQLIEVNAPAVRGVFTADHRFVARNKHGAIIERTAGWVASHSGLDGMIPFGNLVQAGSDITPIQARVLACVAADGSIAVRAKSWGAIQWGFHKERKAVRLRELLVAAQVEYTEHKYGPRYSFLVSNPPEWMQCKGFGSWILGISQEAGEALLDELVHWDGFKNTNNGADTFCTTQKGQAEWVQTLAHLRNRRASLYEFTHNNNYTAKPVTIYNVYFGSGRATSVDTKRQVRVVSTPPLVDKVYCPTVESSYILVRYNGAIHVTGQCQNLPSKHKSNIRKAFRAPEGYRVVVVDSAQIELRINFWQSGQQDKLDILTNGGCVYVAEACAQFGIDLGGELPKKGMVTDEQRQYGKVCQLGLGYSLGAKKFQKVAAAGPMGMDPIYLTMEQSYKTVMTYRETNPMIPKFWRKLDHRIHQMTLPDLHEQDGCLLFVHNGVILPSGRMLQYNGLRQNEDGQWIYGVDKRISYIYGAKLCENLTQALARDVVFAQMLKIDERYRVVSSTHDEVWFLAPEAEAEEALAFGIEVFSQTPDWAPGLILSAEGAHAEYYSK